MKRLVLHCLLGLVSVVFMVVGLFPFSSRGQHAHQFVDDIANSDAVSRYDFSRLVLDIECVDCVYGMDDEKTRFTEEYVAQMENVGRLRANDLSYDTAAFNEENYYYCVIENAEKGYLVGYPEDSGTLCAGDFCGDNLVTYADALPVLYRVLRSYVYPFYSIDWSRVAQWNDTVDALPDRLLPILTNAESLCQSTDCVLSSGDELDVYLAYCADHMAECGYQTFALIPREDQQTLFLNFLVRHDVIERDHAMDIELEDIVLGSDLVTYTDLIREFVDCSYEDDPDGDGVVTSVDSCPLLWNPSQQDFDSDGKGDVCDEDIDNDGLTHPLQVVDDSGRIDIEKYEKSDDPILFGDVENQQIAYGLRIIAEPGGGRTPLEVIFTGVVVGPIDRLERRFGDGYSALGWNQRHTYTEPGTYTVTVVGYAKGKRVAYSITTLEVLVGSNLEVGYQIANITYNPALNEEMELSHIYAGEISQATRTVGESIANTNPGELYPWSIARPGLYYVESQAYNTFGEWVGLSQLSLDVPLSDGARGSALVVDTLTPSVGDILSLRTEYAGFGPSDVELVLRDFGDESTAETTTLTTQKQYSETGPKIIQQLISFTDSSIPPHENVVTVYVTSTGQPLSLQLVSDKISYDVGEEVEVRGVLEGVSASEIRKLIWKFGDGTEREFTSVSALLLRQQKTYLQPGTYPVGLEVLLVNGDWLRADITLQVVGDDICLGDLSGFVCDMDSDGIPDICDADIDGDGVMNLIGRISVEPEGCQYTEQDEEVCKGEDNCGLTPNPNQTDTDGDGIGDACDATPNSPDGGDGGSSDGGGDGNDDGSSDSDGDGVPDDQDACAGVPESGNGSEDGDGCPELPDDEEDDGSDDPFVGVETCTSCPCPYADYASSIRKYDRITAELRDETGSIKYRVTDPAVIERDIPDYMLGIE